MATDVKNSIKVVTGKVRFSYAHVFTPTAMAEGEDKKYSVSLIIPKKDKVTLPKIERAIEELKQEFKDRNGGRIPSKFHDPLRDGDDDRPEDPAYENAMFLSAKSNRAPGIVDENREDILDPNEFYSGCYGRASITFFLFDKAGNRGIACALNNLQKLEDGERLSGGASAAEDFADDDDDLL